MGTLNFKVRVPRRIYNPKYSLYREKGRDREVKGHTPGLPASGAGPEYSRAALTWAPTSLLL